MNHAQRKIKDAANNTLPRTAKGTGIEGPGGKWYSTGHLRILARFMPHTFKFMMQQRGINPDA
jgi:hypothetical protein